MPAPSEVSNTPKILIIEDEVMLAEDLARSLTDLCYEVDATVFSYEEAIRLVEESQPELILMDVKLDGQIDGIDTVENIRSRFDIPVVYLTGSYDIDFLEQAKSAEPSGYVCRPVNLLEMRSTIESVLYTHEADRRVRESENRFCPREFRSMDRSHGRTLSCQPQQGG